MERQSNNGPQSSPTGPIFSDAWLKPAWFALILAGLIAAFFPDVLLGGKSFVFRDFSLFTYPNALFQRESFWHGEIPLWNPLNYCGIPFLAQWNMAALYPPTLIYIVLPLTWGLHLFLLLHLFWAGLGMYWLASHWTQNRLAAALAGVAFVFNGLTLNCLMWTATLAALAWTPWVVLLVEQAWLMGGRRLLLAALAGTFQMLAGAPEIIAFTWLILSALWIGKFTVDKPARWHTTNRFTLVGVIVGLLSAAQLLPFLDLLGHSERSPAYGANTWSIPAWGWANLFVPIFHCYQSPLGVFFQPQQDWTSSYYLGAAILTLGVLAIVLVRNPRVRFLAGVAVFGFVLAMGESGRLYPLMLKCCPALGFMRFPVKFVFLTVFAVPLLAAAAIAQFRNNTRKSPVTELAWALVFTTLSVVIIGGILWHAHSQPFPNETWLVLLQNGLWRVAFLVLIVGTFLIYGRIRNLRLQKITGVLLLVFAWLDVVTHAPSQNPTIPASAFQPGLLNDRLNPRPQSGESRAYLTKQDHDLYYYRQLSDLSAEYLGLRCAMSGDCNIQEGIAVPDGFYALRVADQLGIFSEFVLSHTNAFPAGFADFLGVSLISDSEKLLAWKFRPTYQPIYSLGAKPEFVAPSAMPALLLQTNFNPRQVVYLPTEARALVTATNLIQGTVRETHCAAQRLEFATEAEAPALLVLSQTFYHAWRATVDDQPVPILRANYAFQAVEVPAGHHTVKLVYQDARFRLGAVISLATLTGCLLAWLRLARKSQA